jgi:hypothetical protein
MPYFERARQPDRLVARLAEIEREIEHSPPWVIDDLVAEQQALLTELRGRGLAI